MHGRQAEYPRPVRYGLEHSNRRSHNPPMKMAYMKTAYQHRNTLLLSGLLLLAGCVGAPKEAPPAPPAPQPAPTPPAPAMSKDWRAWPVAKGDWSYQQGQDGGSVASFGTPGQPALVAFRCEMPARRIHVLRGAAASTQPGSQIVIHTSFGTTQWPVSTRTNGTTGAVRASNDPVLDQIAFSRGRFAIEVPGAAPVAVPNWPEITRVIEDCRG